MTTISGPYADTRDMYMVHDMFRREFGLAPTLVRGATAGDGDRAKLIADHVTLVTTVLDAHHTGEDEVLWPRLLDRCPDEANAIVHTMEDQHATIHRVIGDIYAAAKVWRDSSATAGGEELADALDRMVPVLVEHTRLEEQRILPLAERYITAAEWHEIGQAGAAHTPPESLPLAFGMSTYEADPEVVEGVLAILPPDISVFLREKAPQLYAAHALRLYGTTTPPHSTTVPHHTH